MKLYRRIRTIIALLPLLWKDQDWDYCFLVRIIQFKLRRMANCIEKNDIVVSAPEIAAQMREVVEHLDKFSDTMNYYPAPDEMPEYFFKNIPQEWKDYYRMITQKEQEHWDAAWKLMQEKCQWWWD